MARTCKNDAVHTLTGRRGLAPGAAPYWRAVRMGLRVGWRRRPHEAAGVWLARLALPGNKILQKALGGADDPPVRADGVRVLNYAQAVDAAQKWASRETQRHSAAVSGRGQRRTPTPATVKAALEAYQDARACQAPLAMSGAALATMRQVKARKCNPASVVGRRS
jgi:hypothetical protein